jgi:hypothetical protein
MSRRRPPAVSACTLLLASACSALAEPPHAPTTLVAPSASAASPAAAPATCTPTLGPVDVVVPESPWRRDVTRSPVAAGSDAMLAATRFGHGAPAVDFGLKVLEIRRGTPFTPVQFHPAFLPDSDTTPVPVPRGGALEGETGYACAGRGDCHLLVIDPSQRRLFELWHVTNTSPDGTGAWSAEDETVWLMDGQYGPEGRGVGCTSADAAGLSIVAGLIGVREANAGKIEHALRFILPNARILNRNRWIAPATHGTDATTSHDGLPYGARLRLKPSFDAGRVPSKGGKAVIAALKKYGMFLADGGQDAFTAESSDLYAAEGLGWSGVLARDDLSALTPADFDVVDYDPAKIRNEDDCVRAPLPAVRPRPAR